MDNLPILPDLNSMPSVLEVAEVNAALDQIIAAAEHNPTVQRNAAVELMVDAIFAQGYRPGERLDGKLSEHILRWIQAEWTMGDIAFAAYATTVLANLNCAGVGQFVRELLASDQRDPIQESLRSCLREYTAWPPN